jgi:LmbE family N-acetylglucosaminyl deacetylase
MHEVENHSQLVYRLMGLGMAGAALHIGAHPDDEDIGLLAYLSCKYGVRAVYWSATRGEGGQNRIGPYTDEALGVYRTWESLAARSLDRSECLFGPFYDFGYSKNAEETLARWGQSALIREIVRAIRSVQPHVVVSRWTGAPADFHGQHQAVGQAALQAFEAAGDPNRFPELKAQGLAAWQPLKFYYSADNSRGDLTVGGALNLSGQLNPHLEKPGVLRINTGEFDPVSGKTYQERAWMAYNKHQTQAMGLPPAPGDFYYYFSLIKSLVPAPERESDIFDGIDPSLTGLADYVENGFPFLRGRLERIKKKMTEALNQYRADDPMKASSCLLEALSMSREICEAMAREGLHNEAAQAVYSYLSRKTADLEEVTAECLGLRLECLSERPRVIPGHRFQVSVSLWNHGKVPIDSVTFKALLPEGWEARRMDANGPEQSSSPSGSAGAIHESSLLRSLKADFEIVAPQTAALTTPYWLTKARGNYIYHWPENDLLGHPFGLPPVTFNCEVRTGDHTLKIEKAVTCRQGFPGGYRDLNLAVAPPISIYPDKDKEFLQTKDEEQHVKLQVAVYNNSDQPAEGCLEAAAPEGWKITPEKAHILLEKPRETKTLQHIVAVPAGALPGRYMIKYKIRIGERDYATIVTPVRMGAPGLTAVVDDSNCVKEEFILTPSQVTIHLIGVRFSQKLQYAYVQGIQEELLEVLERFNIHFHLIGDGEMGHLGLSRFDAVVIGPNAYLIREELRRNASRFLEYVRNGGTLIVQYQRYGYQTPGFAPYPFQYNQPHDRVTHEDAPVTILDPDHSLFRAPNPITAEDFTGWVRDRGLYFFHRWDKRYHTLLSCSDPGEEPLEGGLVECHYGRGTFLYTGYSFFRQVPAGVSGALRLFANILALPEARIQERIEFIRKVSLFSLLTEQQMDAIARIMSERWVEDGIDICRQGEFGDELYIVYQGTVEVIRQTGDREQTLFVAKEGDCLGEMAVLGNIPRVASLRARGDVHLLIIEGTHFHSLLRQHPEMSIHMIKLLVNRLVPSEG